VKLRVEKLNVWFLDGESGSRLLDNSFG
jgi:hypothetical protein